MNPYENNENTGEIPAASTESTSSGSHTGASPYMQTAPSSTAHSAQTGYGTYQTPQSPQVQQPQQNSYSWGPAYYPYQQPQPKKKEKKGGRFFVKALAAVLCCAVVSLGSVGVFAAMIQNGVVNVQSPENAEQTAAFTLYKRAEGTSTTPTATRSGMTTQEIAQNVIPSVVCVQNYQMVHRQNGSFFDNFFMGGMQEDDDEGGELAPAGEGSGVIISEDGYIVTNQHVIDGATNLSVVTSDGATYEAKLVGEDTQTDLAVIKIEADEALTPADFGDSEDLQVTDQVLAIGNPGGLQFNSSVTIGYVSALNRAVTNSDTGFVVNCIQTDAAINPGNSGGALVNTDGLVVGINSSKIAATDYEGMGFAIPSSVVQPVVSDLIEHGYVTNRPMLGITGGFVNRSMSSFTGLSQGYYVNSLVTSEAEASGLQVYDVITAIDDTQVTSSNTIPAYIANKKPGDKVTLTVDRALSGETGLKIELTLSANTGASE